MSDNSPTPHNQDLEPVDLYDPQTTPDTLFGLFMMGLEIDEIARILRVSVEKLMEWVVEHEELRIANDKVLRADALVITGAFKLASGHSGADGKYYPPNLPAIKWWVQFRKLGLRKPDSKRNQNVSDEDRIRTAKTLKREIDDEIPVTIKSRTSN